MLNPVQAICPVCLKIKVLSAMNQLRSLMQHFRERHEEDYRAVSIGKRLKGWVENNFISLEQLNEISPVPEGLISPEDMFSTPQVRALVLARDIP